MALRNSATGEVRRSYSIEELKDAEKLMRGYDLVALHAAGSGHAGGTLSIMDITAALYLRVADHDPADPNWEDRDRIIWSTGHKAPSLYLGLAVAGFGPIEDVVLLRKLGSPYQGHLRWISMGIAEQSATSVAAGLAKEGKLPVFGTYATFAARAKSRPDPHFRLLWRVQRDDRGSTRGVRLAPTVPPTRPWKTCSRCAVCPT